MARYIDIFLLWIKWPVALFLLLSVPALLRSFDYFNFLTPKYYALAGGVILYFVTMVTAGYNVCHNMQIISHELTHTFFAYLTLHDAGRIRLNPDGTGGSMILKGRGNWIITLSPYFFPLFAFFYMLLMPFLLRISGEHWLVYGVFGYLIAYYWVTVAEQVHPKQTDIIKEGYIFSIITIVAANLWTTGIMLAFTSKLWEGVKIYLSLVWSLNLSFWDMMLKSIVQNLQ